MIGNILARIARQHGDRLLDSVIPATAKPKSLGGKLAGAVLLRIASRSVPGAIVITGGLVAKLLYDCRHAKKDGQ